MLALVAAHRGSATDAAEGAARGAAVPGLPAAGDLAQIDALLARSPGLVVQRLIDCDVRGSLVATLMRCLALHWEHVARAEAAPAPPAGPRRRRATAAAPLPSGPPPAAARGGAWERGARRLLARLPLEAVQRRCEALLVRPPPELGPLARRAPDDLDALRVCSLAWDRMTCLDLGHKGLGDAELKTAAAALRGRAPLRLLDLSGNAFGAAGLAAVLAALPQLPALRTLRLEDNDQLGAAAARLLTPGPAAPAGLNQLRSLGTPARLPAALRPLAAAAYDTDPDGRGDGAADLALQAVSLVVEGRAAAAELATAPDAAAVLTLLRRRGVPLARLETLDLSGREWPLAPADAAPKAAHFAALLALLQRRARSLRHLRLGGCGLTDAHLCCLVDALPALPQLRRLDVRHNARLSSASGALLLQHAPALGRLAELRLDPALWPRPAPPDTAADGGAARRAFDAVLGIDSRYKVPPRPLPWCQVRLEVELTHEARLQTAVATVHLDLVAVAAAVLSVRR